VAHREGIKKEFARGNCIETETQLKEALIKLSFALFIEIPQKGSNIKTPPQHVNNNRSTILHRYPVANRVRLVEIGLKKHIPSQISIVGNHILKPYEGQPPSCYGCNAPGYQYINCPFRKKPDRQKAGTNPHMWALIVQRGIPETDTETQPPTILYRTRSA
jgi:hypothetical protein